MAKAGDRVKVESKGGVHEGIVLPSPEGQKTKIIILLLILTIFTISISQNAHANHIVGFYADKNGYWSGGVKYYVHETSDVQFNVEDNSGDGLSLINGGVVVYRVDQNGDELVAVQCNQEELQNPDGICNNYDIAQNGKLAWSWDQKYYTGNPKKDDATGDGINDFVPEGKYYGTIITTPHKNYAAGTTQYETQTFVLDADDDGDAVPNGADKCLQTFGSGKGDALGCPDADNDGVPDETDRCLEKAETVNGYLDSDGCPDELFAGGPPQGRCSGERCKQIALKNEARKEGQIGVVLEAAGTLFGIHEKYKDFKQSPKTKYPGLLPIGIAFEAVSDYFIVKSAKEKIEKDPPDPNYKLIVYLKKSSIKLLEVTDNQTKIINGLFLSGRDYADAIDAFIAANEKYLGAKEADDKYWTDVHAAEVRKYAVLAANKLREHNKAIARAKAFIAENGADIVITKDLLKDFQNNLRERGVTALPQEEIEMLKVNLGGNDTDVENLVNNILNIDANNWEDETIIIKIEKAKEANENLAKRFDDLSTLADKNLLITSVFVIFSVAVIVSVLLIGLARRKHG